MGVWPEEFDHFHEAMPVDLATFPDVSMPDAATVASRGEPSDVCSELDPALLQVSFQTQLLHFPKA